VACAAGAIAAFAGEDLDRARALHSEGKLIEALALYRQVATGEQAVPADVAVAHNNACVILTSLADYGAAAAECEDALRLRRQLDDARGLSRTLNNLGLAQQYLGRYDEAEASFVEALDRNRERGDAEGEAINLANLGVVATQRGRYGQAFDRHAEVEALAGRHAGEPWAAEQALVAGLNQGVVLERVGAFREALARYLTLLAAGEALSASRRASLLANLGVVYRNLGDPVRAVEVFREAADLQRSSGDRAGLANTLLNLGITLHQNLARPDEAEVSYHAALALASQAGDRQEEVQSRVYLGRLLLEEGRPGEAEPVLHAALDLANAAGSAEGRWGAREGLGRVAAARGDLERANLELEAALEAVEEVSGGIDAGGLRAGYLAEKRPAYAAAVQVLARLESRSPGAGHAEAALAVVQRAKARDLLDAIGSRRREAVLPLTAAQIAARTGDGCLLEFFVGEDRVYRWEVDRDSTRLTDLGAAEPVRAQVLRTHRALASGHSPEGEDLASLSRILLGGSDLCGGKRARLWIAPDDRLRYLPFEILPDPLRPGEILLDSQTIAYLPSGSALGGAGSGVEAGVGVPAMAGFAAPVVRQDEGGQSTPLGLIATRLALPPLPSAVEDLRSASRWLEGDSVLRTGAEATEAAFRDAVARGARVIHLATHSVVEEQPGREGAVLFTPAGADDGLLHPREVAELDYHGAFAVLASCSTALGERDGRVLSSLTGAFLAGGASGVVATLWDVDDVATSALMEQFYYGLGRGAPPAVALRDAKRRLAADSQWGRSDLWAGFVLLGDPPPVSSTQSRWVWWLLAAAAVFGLAALWLRRRRRRDR